MTHYHLRSLFWLVVALSVSMLAVGCKPISARGAIYTAPDAAFTLALPPDFEIVSGSPSAVAVAASMDISYTGFHNAETGERIAVAFMPITRDTYTDAQVLRFGISNLPLGDEWDGRVFDLFASSTVDGPDIDYRAAKVMADDTIRFDLRMKNSDAALSMYLEQHGQTLAVLAVTNPHEPEHGALGAALLDTLLPTFVWPAPAAQSRLMGVVDLAA